MTIADYWEVLWEEAKIRSLGLHMGHIGDHAQKNHLLSPANVKKMSA